ncbi:UNKNOWN [Stylonychia lemnae]|uniref:Transmembrane protein n=1 Tax=Stylonychia lemnae TaxID=5949 RepID=A0A078AHZ4_STYLE|nr:UNKNOWN [Stylonychia lemnae]|eukprot:CDW81546.1 UNKNOWN [Stylonychia lemnae]
MKFIRIKSFFLTISVIQSLISGDVLGGFISLFCLIGFFFCWICQCCKYNYQRGTITNKCSCEINRLICKKKTPGFKKENSELVRATQRGIISLPNYEIIRIVAQNNNPIADCNIPIVMGQPELQQTELFPNPVFVNSNQPMFLNSQPIFPPSNNENTYETKIENNQDTNMIVQKNTIMHDNEKQQKYNIAQFPIITHDNQSSNSNQLDSINKNSKNQDTKHEQEQQQPQSITINRQVDHNNVQLSIIQNIKENRDNQL